MGNHLEPPVSRIRVVEFGSSGHLTDLFNEKDGLMFFVDIHGTYDVGAREYVDALLLSDNPEEKLTISQYTDLTRERRTITNYCGLKGVRRYPADLQTQLIRWLNNKDGA